jgi:hypothetical protein
MPLIQNSCRHLNPVVVESAEVNVANHIMKLEGFLYIGIQCLLGQYKSEVLTLKMS